MDAHGIGLAAALDLVVSRTHHARYRVLCDPRHPAFDPAYVPLILVLAGAPVPVPELTPSSPPSLPAMGVGSALDVIRRRDACRSYVPRARFGNLGISDCGCGLDHCRLGRGRGGGVTLTDCASCPDLPGGD